MAKDLLALAVHPVFLSIIFVVVISAVMGLFTSKQQFQVDGRTVVITGGSSGMGKALAKQLAEKGANVCIVARNKDKLNEAIEYIKSHAKRPELQRFLAISADCTSPEENSRILSETTKWNNNQPPDIVWANAGASVPGLFIDTTLDVHRKQMDMNYWTAFYLAHATLSQWLKSKASTPTTSTQDTREYPRHLIITSSSVAFVGVAGYTPYGPAKAALRSLADSLRMELNLYNASTSLSYPPTKVHLVCPGTILSPGYDAENATKHPVTKLLEKDDPKQTADQVAKASLDALARGEYLITTQWLGHAMRVSSLGGSPRHGWGVVDVLFGWVTSVAWLFIAPDMEAKVWKWGKENRV